MKKQISFIILSLCYIINVSAQESRNDDRKRWGTLGLSLTQLVTTNKKFDSPEPTEHISTYPYPFVQGNLKIRVYKDLGIFFDFGVGANKHKYLPIDYNNHTSLNLDNYYHDLIHYQKKEGIMYLVDIGLFYKFYYKKWAFVPHLGWRAINYSPTILSYTLKEKGTNEKYLVNYIWETNSKNNNIGSSSGLLSLKLKAERNIYRRLNLNFGVEFNFDINRRYYKESIVDFYTNESLHNRTLVINNKLHSIGFIVGINLR